MVPPRNLATVPFQGATLIVMRGATPAETLVAMKPLVEGMGLAWEAQHRKLTSHPVLGKGITEITIPSAGGPQAYTALPLSRLNFWLATIHSNKVPDPQTRARVLAYQAECADVLFEHFYARASAARQAAMPALDDPRALRQALLGYTERVIALEEKVTALEPKAAALERLAGRVGSENITTTAKGLRLSPGFLFRWLGEHGWTYRRHDRGPWRARQDKIDAGHLECIETPDRTRDDRSFLAVHVTPKGRARLAEIFSQAEMSGLRSSPRAT